MPLVESLEFQDARGLMRKVMFLDDPEAQRSAGFHTTVVTGHNGCHKSTMLRELVAALTLSDPTSKVTLRDLRGRPHHHVLCTSGSVADRFPPKELPGGIPSRFDVPNYGYLGQRAGPNILSKKAPLETMLTFALDWSKSDRFEQDFFLRAHRLAGLESQVAYTFQRRDPKGIRDLLGRVQSVKSLEKGESRPKRTSSEELYISYQTAQWLLEEFEYEDFNQLEQLIAAKPRRGPTVLLSPSGASCESCKPSVIRLGMLLDLLRLVDCKVTPVDGREQFSIFDLSSGEYHMYTSILGLGFGVNDSSFVLIDEPENSLHPQWQREFMEALFGICDNNLVSGHLIVCTHSPLIVATAREGSTVVDLSFAEPQVSRVLFGASSEELLLSQFGVGSSRARAVVDTVQKAVSLVERGEVESEEFVQLEPDLRRIQAALSSSDPLVPVLSALLGEEVKDERRV